MRLLLARHAQAVNQSEWVRSDEARYLTETGRQQALTAGTLLGQAGEQPSRVLASPLTRAVQTAELLAQGLGYRGVIESTAGLEPGARLSLFLDALASAPPDDVVLAVGHEPHMSEWSAALLGVRTPPRPYRPGTVLVLDFDGVPEPGQATVSLHVGGEGLERL